MLVSSCKAAFSTVASDLPSPGFQLACFGGKLQQIGAQADIDVGKIQLREPWG